MAEDFPEESWVDWGNIILEHVQIHKRWQKNSRYAAQKNADSSTPCCLGFILPRDGGADRKFLFGKKDEVDIRFAIAGGSDEPHFRVTMRHKSTDQVATIAFSSWTFGLPQNSATRVVNKYPNVPPSGPHDFSLELFNVYYNELEEFPAHVDQRKWFATTEKTIPLTLRWHVSERPSGLGTEVNTTGMTAECAQMFDLFRCLLRATEVCVYGRGNHHFLDCWKYFCAQPAPTPPHWWRFATRIRPNQPVLKSLPPNNKGSQLWQHHHDHSDEEKQIFSIPHRSRFMNRREYEIFVVGSLLRAAQAQENLHISHWNGRYEYTLQPTEEPVHTLKSDKAYVITLRLQGRWGLSTPDIPPPPDVGSGVVIIDDNHEFAGFVQAVDDDNVVSLLVTTTKGTGAIVLNNRHSTFRFGSPGAPFLSAQKAIDQALYFAPHPGYQPWIRFLALAQQNQTIRLLHLPPLVASWRQLFTPLSTQQDIALSRTCMVGSGHSLDEIINIVQGPPGTGKTHLIGQAALDAYTNSHKLLVVAETSFATHADAVAVEEGFIKAGIPIDQLFLIEHTAFSGMDFGVETNDSDIVDDGNGLALGALWGTSFNTSTQMYSNSRINVIHQIQKLVNAKPLSLEAHINKRVELMKKDDPSLTDVERALLWKLVQMRQKVGDPLLEPKTAGPVYKDFMRTWSEIQSLYLTSHARVVIAAATTSLHRILRSFKPVRLIIDEGSQMKEYTAVAVIGKHFNNLRKLTIIGDLQQLSPFVPPLPSEFSSQTQLSFMGRMVKTGVPYTMLNTQYRMHPHIAKLVSSLFYNDQLINDPSVVFRQDDNRWLAFTNSTFGDCPRQHSIFISARAGPVYYTLRGRSLANPRHVCIIDIMLRKLRDAGAEPNQIAVLCAYKAQLRVLRTLPSTAGVTLATIDASQGHEYPFVLLDLVTPGGYSQYRLGFLTDTGRMCVALSRAMNGLLIVGNADMCEGMKTSHGANGWKRLVDDHRTRGALAHRNPPDTVLRDMVKHLGLEGPQWGKRTPGFKAQ